FGVLQSESSPLYIVLLALGLVTVLGLHLVAATRELAKDRPIEGALAAPSKSAPPTEEAIGYLDACAVSEIPEKRARIVCLSGERVAIFKYDGKVSAVSNVCQHQNGPLGEGRISDGCITCPWHGYQYQPDTGASPPPFVE